uniref:Uncharacterized protein n=1 Tax=Arundo donax TaxID=35708 RepID=A0A0A9H813_ARUDO
MGLFIHYQTTIQLCSQMQIPRALVCSSNIIREVFHY